MQRIHAAVALVFFALAGCRTASVVSDGVPAPPPPGAANAIVPAGTMMEVELEKTIDTRTSRVGDRFTATVKEAVNTGTVVVPKGARVNGIITGLDGSDRIGDQAAVRLAFQSIELNGRTHAFAADITDVDVDIEDRARIGDTAEKAGVGAAAGAVLGAIIGGSLKDILIGGVLGAGAGTIVSLGLGDVEAALPAGTDLSLRTTRSVALR